MEVKAVENLPETSAGRSLNAFEIIEEYGHEQQQNAQLVAMEMAGQRIEAIGNLRRSL